MAILFLGLSGAIGFIHSLPPLGNFPQGRTGINQVGPEAFFIASAIVHEM